MSEVYKRRTVMQDVEDPPVIEDRKKPPMGEGKAPPRGINGKLELMPEGEPPDHAADEPGMMPPLPQDAAAYTPPLHPPEMQPIEVRLAEGKEERYVRMRVRVHGDQMEVVGAWAVEGRLVHPEKLHSGLAYEVAVGEKQLVMGSIPDVGVRRSFPPPESIGEMKGHHIEEMPSYEFPVRVPQQELSDQVLPDLHIAVYRIKGAVPERQVTGTRLLDQFPEELRPVAELKGIHLQDLPEGVQTEIKKALER